MFRTTDSVALLRAALCISITFGETRGFTAVARDDWATAVQRKRMSASVAVTEAWARPALKGGTGGIYMTITNSGASAVRIARATSLDAAAVELHESSDHAGMAHMQRLPTLEIAPGASATLKPGGKHFMLIGLRRKFVVHDTMRVVLLVEEVQNQPAKSASPRAHVITALAEVRAP